MELPDRIRVGDDDVVLHSPRIVPLGFDIICWLISYWNTLCNGSLILSY